jgi:hypothetical protein
MQPTPGPALPTANSTAQSETQRGSPRSADSSDSLRPIPRRPPHRRRDTRARARRAHARAGRLRGGSRNERPRRGRPTVADALSKRSSPPPLGACCRGERPHRSKPCPAIAWWEYSRYAGPPASARRVMQAKLSRWRCLAALITAHKYDVYVSLRILRPDRTGQRCVGGSPAARAAG